VSAEIKKAEVTQIRHPWRGVDSTNHPSLSVVVSGVSIFHSLFNDAFYPDTLVSTTLQGR
jgi:hypothetical protein